MSDSSHSARSFLARQRANTLLTAVGTLGAVVGAVMLMTLRIEHWEGLLLVVALAAVLERLGTQLFTQSRVSVSAAAIIGAGILYGPAAAVPVAVTVAFAAWVLRGKPVSRLVYNSTSLVLAGVAAAAAYSALTARLPEGDLVMVAAAVVAGLAMWLVSSILVGSMIAATTGTRFQSVVKDNYLWLAGHFTVMGLVALGLALAWSSLGYLGFAAFIAPVGVLAMALRQGASKARGAMLDAASANQAVLEYERLLAELEASSEDVAELIALRRQGAPALAA